MAAGAETAAGGAGVAGGSAPAAACAASNAMMSAGPLRTGGKANTAGGKIVAAFGAGRAHCPPPKWTSLELTVSADDDYRVRLEGRAELLEVARLRFVALAQMLQSFRWRSRLRRNTALLRETAASAEQVDAAIDHLERKVRRERWSRRAAVVKLGEEVSQLWDETLLAARRRLPQSEHLSMRQTLEQLELHVLAQPRLVLPGQRWQVAHELLPRSLPELQVVARFGAALEDLFKRPLQPLQPLPFRLADFEHLRRLWPDGDAALLAVWRRVASLDAAGTLTRFLRRRARRAPMRRANTGPELLLAAEFWRSFALARLKEAADARLAPLTCREDELFPVVAWQLARQEDPAATLFDPAVPPARAGLLELAHELSVPPKRSGGALVWRKLAQAAARADQGAKDEADYARLRDNLSLFLRVVNRPEVPPLYRQGRSFEPLVPTGASLSDLVEAIRMRVA